MGKLTISSGSTGCNSHSSYGKEGAGEPCAWVRGRVGERALTMRCAVKDGSRPDIPGKVRRVAPKALSSALLGVVWLRYVRRNSIGAAIGGCWPSPMGLSGALRSH